MPLECYADYARILRENASRYPQTIFNDVSWEDGVTKVCAHGLLCLVLAPWRMRLSILADKLLGATNSNGYRLRRDHPLLARYRGFPMHVLFAERYDVELSIIALNDAYGWTFEQIADWLESLDRVDVSTT